MRLASKLLEKFLIAVHMPEAASLERGNHNDSSMLLQIQIQDFHRVVGGCTIFVVSSFLLLSTHCKKKPVEEEPAQGCSILFGTISPVDSPLRPRLPPLRKQLVLQKRGLEAAKESL